MLKGSEIQSVTLAGFVVLDRDGGFVAWAEHAEVALSRLREDDADTARRCRDDALIAMRKRTIPVAPLVDQPGRPVPYVPEHLG